MYNLEQNLCTFQKLFTEPFNHTQNQTLFPEIQRRSYHHIETSRLISSANQMTGFYMMVTLAFNELTNSSLMVSCQISFTQI